jgi:hypothetical protein
VTRGMGASSAMYIYVRLVVLMYSIKKGRLDTLRAKPTPVSHCVTGAAERIEISFVMYPQIFIIIYYIKALIK